MRFMVIRKADSETEARAMPSRELVRDMMAYNEEARSPKRRSSSRASR